MDVYGQIHNKACAARYINLIRIDRDHIRNDQGYAGKSVTIQKYIRDVLKKMEATYGLDKPPVEQFIIYCKNLLHGDMGTSYKKVGKSVNEIIAQTMMPTLQLGIVTFVLVLVVGVSSGILMARAKSNAVKVFGYRH